MPLARYVFILLWPLVADVSLAADGAELIPRWARTGQFRFARWDGGPLETAKAILSGWPYFVTPDPEVIYATTNWYEPRTIDLLERAHMNWIWVTWSNGFSNETERWQQNLLQSYMKECQRRGIRVSAYLSTANIFWEDMFEQVPESKNWLLKRNGQPVPYGAGDYQKVGRVTRYMADLSHKGWQDFVLARALAAVSAGADGLMFDNNFDSREQLEQFKSRVLTEARKRNPHILVNSNYHEGMYIAARYENAITTEDGKEPGIFRLAAREEDSRLSEDGKKHPDRGVDPGISRSGSSGKAMWSAKNEEYSVGVRDGQLVLNVGLLRSLWAVSQGWRPITVEYGARHIGDRFNNMYSVAHLKLALAESHAFHASLETYQEAKTLRDLYFNEKNALEHWQALGQYNAFFQKHAALYASPQSLACIAVVIGSRDSDIAFLNRLAARNVMYDVIYVADATTSQLAKYSVVIAAPSIPQPRPEWKRLEKISDENLIDLSLIRTHAPDTVIVNVHRQAETSRTLVHLLNYSTSPIQGVEIAVKGKFKEARLFSPDLGTETRTLQTKPEGEATRVQAPRLEVYDLIVLE